MLQHQLLGQPAVQPSATETDARADSYVSLVSLSASQQEVPVFGAYLNSEGLKRLESIYQ